MRPSSRLPNLDTATIPTKSYKLGDCFDHSGNGLCMEVVEPLQNYNDPLNSQAAKYHWPSPDFQGIELGYTSQDASMQRLVRGHIQS